MTRRANARLLLVALFMGLFLLLAGVSQAQAQSIALVTPADEAIVSPSTGATMRWTPTGTVSSFQIQFSTDDSFTPGDATIDFPRLGGMTKTLVKVDSRTWKRVVGKVVNQGGLVYWRVRGVSPGGVVISATRTLYISSASVEGQVDVLMSQESVREGDEIPVALLVNAGADELGAVSVRLRVNPDVLEVKDGQVTGVVLGAPYFASLDAGTGTLYVSFMNIPEASPQASGLVHVGNLIYSVLAGSAGGTAAVSGTVMSVGERGGPSEPLGADTPRPAVGGGALEILGE